MSIPVIPGYLERPTPGRLVDLWRRPEGDFPNELWPVDALTPIEREPTGWLTVCERYPTDERSIGRGCVLVSAEGVAATLENTNWVGSDLGTSSVWRDSEGHRLFESGLKSTDRALDLEFFVQVKRPVGSPKPVLDLSYPFLWYFDAYPARDGWAYVNSAGRPQDLVRVSIDREHWTVEVRALEFRHFLDVCGRHAVLQVSCVSKTRTRDFARIDCEFGNDWAHFDFVAIAESAYSDGGGFSRVLGQYIVIGTPTSRTPRSEEHRAEVDYPEFIVGVDASSGQPVLQSCNPNELGTYFDQDNSRLHFLTPVNFKREVLLPYAREPNRYRLRRSRLECLNLWGLDISINTAGLVEVYLGDLGRYLPADEWSHWRTHNVIPDGEMEEGRFRRDFMNQFASSPDIPSDLRRARDDAAAESERALGSPVWRVLDESISPEFESMIGPLGDDPSALQGPLILLAKCFVDAIDPAPLKKFLGDAEVNERSLSLLGRTAERLGGSTDDVHALRALWKVRSAGGFAHLGGSGREAALTELGIADMNAIEAFDHIALRIIDCLSRITHLLEAHAGEEEPLHG